MEPQRRIKCAVWCHDSVDSGRITPNSEVTRKSYYTEFRLSWSPIIEFVDDTGAYREPYLATAFDRVTTGFDLTCLSDPVRP